MAPPRSLSVPYKRKWDEVAIAQGTVIVNSRKKQVLTTIAEYKHDDLEQQVASSFTTEFAKYLQRQMQEEEQRLRNYARSLGNEFNLGNTLPLVVLARLHDKIRQQLTAAQQKLVDYRRLDQTLFQDIQNQLTAQQSQEQGIRQVKQLQGMLELNWQQQQECQAAHDELFSKVIEFTAETLSKFNYPLPDDALQPFDLNFAQIDKIRAEFKKRQTEKISLQENIIVLLTQEQQPMKVDSKESHFKPGLFGEYNKPEQKKERSPEPQKVSDSTDLDLNVPQLSSTITQP